jgi:hypothetical protein
VNFYELFSANYSERGEDELLKGERMFLKRVCALPSDLADVYLDDLKATAEERLAFFERLTIQRKKSSI